MTSAPRPVLLTADHNTASFDCGTPALNKWLQREASRAQQSGTARVYVWAEDGTNDVTGYFAISPTIVASDTVSRGLSGGVTTVPAYLLGKFALDTSLHGKGLGTALLLDALDVVAAAADAGGGRLVVVDAIDNQAHDFYVTHDFRPVGRTPGRLVMKIATILASRA